MKKRAVILTLAVCVLFSVSGCAAQYDHASRRTVAGQSINHLSYWVGSSISEVIHVHGPYTQAISDGTDGKIYIWVEAPSPAPPARRRRDEDSWVIRPYGLSGYKIERAPQGGSGVLAGIRNNLERQAELDAAREAARPRDRVMFFARADGTIYSWRAEVRGAVYNHSVYDFGDNWRAQKASREQGQKGEQAENIPAIKDEVVTNLASDEQKWKMRNLGIDYDDNITSEEAQKLINVGEHEKMINTLKEAQTQHGQGNRWLKEHTKN